jgi:saccharopine dehydrogenase-like NADP-dependent oxidoreductase
VSIPTKNLFKDPFTVDFPEVGRLEVYPNRDSLAYRDIYGIPEAMTVYRGTFRYGGWCETLDVIKRLGLISYDKSDMGGLTYAGLVAKQILDLGYRHDDTKKNIRAEVADCLGLPVDSHALGALEWLGLFADVPMNRQTDSTFEVVSDLMISKMGLGDHERDMVVMQHTFLAAYSDGRKEVIRSRMLDFGSPLTDTSIARTVALPAAIGVEMILKSEIRETGVHIPVIPAIYNPVLNALEVLGIKMNEEFGLPISENIK